MTAYLMIVPAVGMTYLIHCVFQCAGHKHGRHLYKLYTTERTGGKRKYLLYENHGIYHATPLVEDKGVVPPTPPVVETKGSLRCGTWRGDGYCGGGARTS